MIKSIFLLLTIILSVVLSSCVNVFQPSDETNEQNQIIKNVTLYPDNTDDTSKNIPAPLSDEDFVIKNDDTFIELNGIYENLITCDDIVNVSYLDEKRVYDTYIYNNFTVSVSPAPYNTIFFINLVTSELETSRRVKVGDTMSDVIQKYGLTDEISLDFLAYHYKSKILTFFFNQNGNITNIGFEMI